MKHLKTYEYNSDNIMGAKIGDSVRLTVESLSGVAISDKEEYIISKIFKDDRETELLIVDDVDNFIVLKGFGDIIRAHFFIPTIIYATNRYNI